MATSHALLAGASLQDVCDTAGWSSPHTFIRFNELDVNATLGSRVLLRGLGCLPLSVMPQAGIRTRMGTWVFSFPMRITILISCVRAKYLLCHHLVCRWRFVCTSVVQVFRCDTLLMSTGVQPGKGKRFLTAIVWSFNLPFSVDNMDVFLFFATEH